MATKTLEQLLKDRTALELAFAGIEYPLVKDMVDLMQSDAVVALRDKAVACRDGMPEGQAKTQMNNIVLVIDGVTPFFSDYLDGLNRRLNPEIAGPIAGAPVPTAGPTVN